MKLTHASLFSGFGGPDLASRWMGWDNAFHCEINEFCNTILNYHFPKSKSYKDVTTTDFTPWRGKIDVLTGGFPCQPFSVAGQRKGADDNRYLWPHFLRAIREIQPPWVIGENVAGILSMVQPGQEIEVGCQASLFDEDNTETVLEQEFVVETICQDLEREGYSVQPIIIPACAVGAPHRRDRVWFVAHRADTRTEDMRARREDEVLSCAHASHAASQQNIRRRQSRFFPKPSGIDDEGSIANPDGKRCDNRSDNRKERYLRYDWQRYSQEDKSKRDEWKCRTCKDGANITYANSSKLQAWLKAGGWTDEAEAGTRMDDGAKRFGNLRYASNANRIRPQTGVQSASDESFRRKATYRYAAESSVNGRRALHATPWQDFPTQPPVCRGNDGLPFDVVRLTISYTRWRAESIKGYGNAIVPEVVFELFQAIEEAYN